MSKEDQGKDQKSPPDWISIIEKNANDLTKHMYDLFRNSTLKTNIEKELEEEKKNQKRSSRE